MNFRKIFSKTKKSAETDSGVFLALELSEEMVKGAMVGEGIEEIKVEVEKIEKDLTQTNGADWDKVLDGTGKVVAALEEKKGFLGKTVLGIPGRWVEKEELKIKEKYLFNLKTLVEKWGLEIVGFVTIEEAFLNYYKSFEGVPLTAFLFEQTGRELAVVLSRVGQITGERRFQLEGESLEEKAKKIEENIRLLSGSGIFPARILLYGGNDLEILKEILMAIDWTKKLNFLHFPRIEILSLEESIKAVAAAVGMKMAVKGFNLGSFEKKLVSAQEVGFGEAEEERGIKKQIVKADLGHKVKGLISKPRKFLPKPELGNRLAAGTSYLFKRARAGLVKGRVAALGVMMAGVLGGLVFYLVPRAGIKLRVESRLLEKEAEIVAVVGGELDLNKKQIPADLISIRETGTKKGVTTGKKLVGEKAVGEIRIFNKTSTEKEFEAGTVLTADPSLKFVLKEKVTVPAKTEEKSGGDLIPKYGVVSAKAEADEIGVSYNVTAETEFLVSEFTRTSFAALAIQDFKGGSSREVLVVESQDQERLVSSLEEELHGQASQALEGQLAQGQKLAGEVLGVATVKRNFDKKVGDEGESLTLALEQEFQGLSFKVSEATALMKSLTAGAIPEGYKLKEEEVEMEILPLETGKKLNLKEAETSLKVNFKAKLLPEIDEEDLRKKMTGKKVEAARDFLNSQSNISSFELTFKPGWLERGGILPLKTSNISIEIVSK